MVAASLLLAWLAFPLTARAHSGAPYPVLLEERVGPYIVSVLADPDVGTGTFYLEIGLAQGGPAPADTQVTVWVRPEDGHAAEAGYPAQPQTASRDARETYSLIAKIPFDAEGMWQVRLTLEGTAGKGEATFNVRVTPPGPGWVRTLLCFLPFIFLGILWVFGARRQQRDRSSDRHLGVSDHPRTQHQTIQHVRDDERAGVDQLAHDRVDEGEDDELNHGPQERPGD